MGSPHVHIQTATNWATRTARDRASYITAAPAPPEYRTDRISALHQYCPPHEHALDHATGRHPAAGTPSHPGSVVGRTGPAGGHQATTVVQLERQPRPLCRGRTLAGLAAALGGPLAALDPAPKKVAWLPWPD